MEERRSASTRSLAGSATMVNNKSYEFRALWHPFVNSHLFLAFAILATVALGAAAFGFAAILEIVFRNILAGVQVDAMYFMIYATSALMIFGAVNVLGIWMHYTDAFMVSKGKEWTPGLSLIVNANRILLGVVIVAFIVTLPAFTEWMEYDAANELFLQIIYVVMILIGLWCAGVMIIAQKIREKLSVWVAGEGPVTAMVVGCLVIAVASLIAMFAFGLWLCLPVVAAAGVLAALLFVYGKKVNKIRG